MIILRIVIYIHIVIFLFGAVFPAFAQEKKDLIPLRPDPVYEELYPYYVEICAVSQIGKLGNKKAGAAGHAVMYLKGGCLDKGAAYPQIKVCEAGSVDLTNKNAGVGVSVNKMFKNVNWVALEGKELFFHGNLNDNERLTKEKWEETYKEAVRRGTFKGVVPHDKILAEVPDDLTVEEYMSSKSIGTDYALRFGRTVFCSRLPVTKVILGDVITYLNDLNTEYATGEAHYNWHGVHDNCTHTLVNALANAGIWKEKPPGQIKLVQLFYLAVPANEFANLALLSNKFPIENYPRIYSNSVMKDTFKKHDWLPTRHGALLKYLPVYQNNDMYDTAFNMFVLEGPFLKTKSSKIVKMYKEDEYFKVRDNLLFYKVRYEEILRNRDRDRSAKVNDYTMTKERYYEYLNDQLVDVNEKLYYLDNKRNKLRSAPWKQPSL